MVAPVVALSLIGLASAGPIARQVVPNYPQASSSKGFNLVVNVTDLSADFSPSIQNTYINSIHTGAGLNLVGVGSADEARLFYQNGTAEESQYGFSTIITDGGSPLTPAGLALAQKGNSETTTDATLNFGPGSPLSITSFPEPYKFVGPDTFAACSSSLEYYGGKKFITILHAETTVDDAGQIHYNIPKGCAPVRLIPECATLNTVPAGSYSSHEFALDSECYSDVSALNWSEYGP